MDQTERRVRSNSGVESGDSYPEQAKFLRNRVDAGISTELCPMPLSQIDAPQGASDFTARHELSPWTRSGAKRAMDVGIVLACSPILIPLLAVIALAVLVTSGAPIFFLQERVGAHGAPFFICKFRTMRPAFERPSSAIAIDSADRITWLGAWLRKSKLDELPQIFNVLRGEMSLVGPRPKVPEQEPEPFPCRPGLTGAATLAFAREEMILQGIASADLDAYFQKTVLSAKRELDANYLRQATAWSDLQILINTVLGRWESDDRITLKLHGEERHLEAARETASLLR